MSFWNLSSGSAASGEAKDAFLSGFGIIPEGTQAEAIIQKINVDSSGDKPFINIHWKLTSGDFKGRIVFQKIRCWDDKPNTADRAKNMLLLIYKLLNHLPSHQDAPTDRDLAPMTNRALGIKILEYMTPEGKQGNHIGEVHKISPEFLTFTGEKKVFTSTPSTGIKSAFSRNPRVTDNTLNDDIPF